MRRLKTVFLLCGSCYWCASLFGEKERIAYHVDIPPNTTTTTTITDIAIQNPTDSDEELPAGSTVVISVNEIEPLS